MSLTFVRPEGNLETASMILIGEQPGKSEIIDGKPFVGPSGKLLNECLRGLEISRSDCYLTNVFKDLDHPLKYYIQYDKGEITFSSEGLHQVENLKEEIKNSKASVIICFGWVPLATLAKRSEIGRAHV